MRDWDLPLLAPDMAPDMAPDRRRWRQHLGPPKRLPLRPRFLSQRFWHSTQTQTPGTGCSCACSATRGHWL